MVMKKFIHVFCIFIFAGILSVLFTVCSDELTTSVTYIVNEPVYMPRSEFRAKRPIQPAQAMVNPGRICLYENYIFISERDKGIHIINNSNPAQPYPVAFIDLPGNFDITVINHLLYADSYVDLLWFDIQNPAAPVEAGRLPDAFSNVFPATGNEYLMMEVDKANGIVVGWTVKTITVEEDGDHPFPLWYGRPDCEFFGTENSWKNNSASPGKTIALNSSVARFAAYREYLYVVNNDVLKVFSLWDGEVREIRSQYITKDVESILVHNNRLFLGTATGMLIYQIANDPTTPVHLSTLSDVLGCNPMAVQGNYAYVTVRGGNACEQTVSQLHVVNISEPADPYTEVNFNLQSPYGLAIVDKFLFVCDKGLKVFDVTIPSELDLISHYDKDTNGKNINGFDVIPYNNILILIGSNGLYQYDYSNQNLRSLGVLMVQQ